MRENMSQYLQASAASAFCNMISPRVLGITVSYSPELMVLRAYFEPGATEDDIEQIDIAYTEIMSDFSLEEIKWYDYEPVTINPGEKMEPLMEWLYIRDKK